MPKENVVSEKVGDNGKGGPIRRMQREDEEVMESQYHLFGMHPVTEALLSGRRIERVVFKQGLEGTQFRQLMELLNEKNIPFQFVPADRMNHLVKGSHQGVIAYLSQIDYVQYDEMIELAMSHKEAPVFLILDGVSDVRNFGAIVRSAECAGVDGVILPSKGGAAINGEAIKASAGALLRVPVARVPNLKMALYYLLDAGFQTVAATEKAEELIYQVNFKKPTAIVMGSEGRGISQGVLDMCTDMARIPMNGAIGSLNVSVATALVLFELVRQRM